MPRPKNVDVSDSFRLRSYAKTILHASACRELLVLVIVEDEILSRTGMLLKKEKQ